MVNTMDDTAAALLRLRWEGQQIQANILHHIYLFGDEIAQQQGYDVDGLEAVALYLLQRDGTPPERTLLYKTDHLSLLLSKELKDRKEPEGFADPSGTSYQAARWRHIEADAKVDYATICFGDGLGEREGFGGLGGEEALRFYLVRKHGWHPADASVLSIKSLGHLLRIEMEGWTMTKAQIAAAKPE